MNPHVDKCPGCGILLPQSIAEPPSRYLASGACWQLINELEYYTLSLADPYFIHQLVVDTYGAQHTGPQTRPITTAFALIGLQLAIEKGYTGRQVQQAHMALALQQKNWPRLTMPDQTGTLTVSHGLLAGAGEPRHGRIHEWAESVWQRWAPWHNWTRDCVNRYQL
ncbi:hypothetical protein J2I47_03365 [Fibrella sp. HMF5335]|uniref:Uncharacterized protein n=1 Tax=Fibrella rubiginis TaxID=2817060 RepID=A0A939GEZ9_9BACT|nr:DUF5946 family protein [Fibrella rubiginis]MBO0935580.1 hypothetical protein [Fibrella rubiginis]